MHLVASPAPTGPQWTTFFDHRSHSSDAVATSSGVLPPSMVVHVPASAPLGPPLTGASQKRMPRSANSFAASAFVCSGSPLVASITSAPRSSGICASTASTSAVVDRQRQRMVHADKSPSEATAVVP